MECVLPARATVGEGIVWDDREGVLWWVDIPAGLVHRTDASGASRAYRLDEPVGCLALREDGGLVLATASGFHSFDPTTGGREAIHDPEPHLPHNRFNDGATDPAGRFWAGTMRDPPDRAAGPQGRFYRLDPDGVVTPWRNGFWTTNGTAFSPDGRTMYLSDSHPSVRMVWAAEYDASRGVPSEPRPFLDTNGLAGRPDGATVDSDGCYWMAGVGGWQVYRVTPDGRIDRTIDMPVERPSKPAFGGARLDTLYVTSIGSGLTPGTEGDQPLAGSVFAIHGTGATGLPPSRFGSRGRSNKGGDA